MTARLFHRIGAALVWAVLGSACLVLLSVFLPLLVVAGLLRALYDGGRWLLDHVRVVDVPDGLDEVLRGQIDGDEVYAERKTLACGCSAETTAYTCARECGWQACAVHLHATHYCEPVPDIATVNDRFARLINSPELRGLRRAPESFAPYYLIGDEK